MSASGVPFPDSPRTMRRLPAASRAHVRAACAALILSLSLSACAMEQTPTFDSGAWKAQRGVAAKDNTRGGMLPAVEAAVQPGMSREDVLRLLGEPDATDAATSTDTYELGVAKFGIDEEFFAIHYRDGKVESRQWQRR
jgi:hypothetical protein